MKKKSVLFLQINLLSDAKNYKIAEIHSKTPNLSRRITYVWYTSNFLQSVAEFQLFFDFLPK